MPGVRLTLSERVTVLENKEVSAHLALEHADVKTAQAVQNLTDAINHPKTGLIVELDRFRAEVAADRKAFRAWIAGAVAVVSTVFTLITILAPVIRALIGVEP